jgi:bacillolysin
VTVSSRTTTVLAAIVIAAGTRNATDAQQPVAPVARSVTASGATLGSWAARVETMLRDGTLDIAGVQSDTMISGRTHQRLRQQYEGLPVFGGELVRQVDGGRVISVFGNIFENVSLPAVKPAIEPSGAASIAERAAGQGAAAETPVLGILPASDRSVLVYRMNVRSAWNVVRYDINATTGAVERAVSMIRHQDNPLIGKGKGVLNDDKKVSVNQITGGFEAVDLFRPAVGFTLDFRGSAARLNAFLQTGRLFNSDIAFNTSNTWTDGSVVDAHAYQGWVYDYYFKRFGRRGLDDQNLEVIALVHPLDRSLASSVSPNLRNTFINNAFYLHPGLVAFGDGDGVVFNFLAGGFDVIAHELTHGVTAFTSDLEYQDEPGALNEAISDILGTGAEFFYFRAGQGPQRGPNFLMGEDVTRQPPGFIRSLQNPNALGYPDHYTLRQFIGTDIDDGGVHVNSTIASHAFYLSVSGGTNRVSGINVQGIGLTNIERMERIFYRAFAFLMGPLSQFADARAATLQAAADLYGANSNERAQVQQAWTAVGVN